MVNEKDQNEPLREKYKKLDDLLKERNEKIAESRNAIVEEYALKEKRMEEEIHREIDEKIKSIKHVRGITG